MFDFLFNSFNNYKESQQHQEIEEDLLEFNKINDADLISVDPIKKKIEYLDDLSFYNLIKDIEVKIILTFSYPKKTTENDIIELNSNYYQFENKFYVKPTEFKYKSKHKKGNVTFNITIKNKDKIIHGYTISFNYTINNENAEQFENVNINTNSVNKIIFTLEKDCNKEYVYTDIIYKGEIR